jgi:hydrogenase 3 maturation protease
MLPALLSRTRGKRLVLVGVGNALRGDDALGCALVDRLEGRTRATLIDAGDVPENYLDVVEAARPEVIVIIDAVALGACPGDVALIEIEQLAGVRVTTHNTSLALVAQALKARTHSDVFILAIQPGTIRLGASLSPEVRATLQALDTLLQEL